MRSSFRPEREFVCRAWMKREETLPDKAWVVKQEVLGQKKN